MKHPSDFETIALPALLIFAFTCGISLAKEKQALFGVFSTKNGRHELKLRQPLESDGKNIAVITIEDGPGTSEEDKPNTGDRIAYGHLDISDPENPVMHDVEISAYGTSVEFDPPPAPRRVPILPTNTLILQQENNTSIQIQQTNISIKTPAAEDNPGRLTEMEKKLVGRWSINNSGASANLSAGPVSLGGSFSQQMVMDLGRDRKSSFTIAAAGPLGDSMRLNMLGVWQIVSHKGKDALLMRFTQFVGDWPRGMKKQDAEMLYIEYAGDGTLILAGEAGARYEFSK